MTPQFIELNITELCNRECSFCPRAHGYPNLNLNMSLDTVEKIIDQAAGWVETIHIVGRGEPCLHPQFLKLIEALEPYFKIRIMTNGDKLHKHIEGLHQILDLTSGRNRVTISLYDGDEQYERLKERFKDYSDISYYKTYDTGQGIENSEFNQKHYITNRAGALYSAISNKPCYIPLNRMFIDWDGTVNLCCHDWTEKAVYGNIHNETIQSIYEHISYKYSKELIKGNRSCTKQCSKCDVTDDDPLKFIYKDWEENQSARIQLLGEA